MPNRSWPLRKSGSPRAAASRSLALAGLAGSVALLLTTAPAHAEELPDRTGARVGLSLFVGAAGFSHTNAPGVSTTAPMVGASFRFGGAFTDRVHLYGEFTLAGLPGASFDGNNVTAFLGALDVGVQVYVLRRLYVRGGFGVVDHATLGSEQAWSYPGPHITGAVGYDLHRSGERAFALEVSVADEFFEGTGTLYNGGYSVALGASFDWF
jgi:hypothetical protein